MKMRRIIVLATAALVCAVQAPSAQATKVKDPALVCRTSDGNGWNHKDIRQGVRCVTDRWHVPGGARKADRVIACESGFGIHARNSCCSGLLQLHRTYFPGWFRRFNPHRGWKLKNTPMNPRTNLVIGLRLAHVSGWTPWGCRNA